MTAQGSPIVIRPDTARMRRVVAVGALGVLVGLVIWWPTLGPPLRFIREHASDARSVVILLLLAGPPVVWLAAYLGGWWFRARVEIDARSLRLTGALAPTQTVARARIASIMQCTVPSGVWGTPTPVVFLVDRRERSVLQLSLVFDTKRVAAVLAVPLVGSFADRMTRAEAEARHGVAPRSKKAFAAIVVGMVAYTFVAIAFIIYVL